VEILENIVAGFRPISLYEMDSVELMNRTDTKFMFSVTDLEAILGAVSAHYRVLEVNGIRFNRYETLYYDHGDFHFYLQHQNGKRNRYKIRKRTYLDSHLTYFEVKFKSNKDRTDKRRTKLPLLEETLEEKSVNFLHEKTSVSDDLVPKLYNTFNRITLVSEVLKERVTLDFDIQFHFGDREVRLPRLVIAEVKQERVNRHSPIMQEIKRRLIRPEGISKYCLGVALLYPDMKQNNFKRKLLKIKKLHNELAA
jgi:hypothetical protein